MPLTLEGRPGQCAAFRPGACDILPAIGALGAGDGLAAAGGGDTGELMERMGHSTTRAALVYLHSTSDRQRAIADAVSKAARTAMRKPRKRETGQAPSGTKVARARNQAS